MIRSNDYSRNVTTSPFKAILLNKVVVGTGYKMTQDSRSMPGPPSGYDSVRHPNISFAIILTIDVGTGGERWESKL
jgi:hypothetical protein